VHADHHAAALQADGDGTIRQTATDVARGLDWPAEFSARILRNDFTRRFAGREAAMREEIAAYGPRYAAAFAAGDPDKAGVWVGEATGLIDDIPPAGAIVARIMREAEACLARGRAAVV
jgi:nitronate monooxygenase